MKQQKCVPLSFLENVSVVVWLKNIMTNVEENTCEKKKTPESSVIHIYLIYLLDMMEPKNKNQVLKINEEGQ